MTSRPRLSDYEVQSLGLQKNTHNKYRLKKHQLEKTTSFETRK